MGKVLFCRKIYSVALVMLCLLIFTSLDLGVAQTARTTIFIRPDGSIQPANVPIQRNQDTYTFTGDVYDPILVQKSNIIIDGAGYALIGPLNESQKQTEQILGIGPNATITVPYIIGIDFEDYVSGVIIQNLNIHSFSIGAYIRTTNNTLRGNSASDNIVGVLLSGSNNNVTFNYLSNNRQGLFGFEQINGSALNIPADIIINQNSFVQNEMQLSGCVCEVYNFSEVPHAWDYNGRGNYWSDYNGTDTDGDGIGDAPYIIDVLNYDRFPLIKSPAQPPAPPAEFPLSWAVMVVVAVMAVLIAVVMLRKRKNRIRS